jgi:hypothetical protein
MPNVLRQRNDVACGLTHVASQETLSSVKQKASGPDKPSEQFRALLGRHQPPVRQVQLAHDLGVSATTVVRHLAQLDDGTLDERAWGHIARILADKYQIDVTTIRPVRATLAVDTSLIPYLDGFDGAQLEALVRILEGSHQQPARDLLLVVARDRLARR